MFGDKKDIQENLKDSQEDSISKPVPYQSKDSLLRSLPKINKLISALYIVTDIMDKDEPIRAKLRTLGVEILSDANSLSRTTLYEKVQLILSLLNIASTINLISEMNFNILKKEFIDLGKSIKESNQINTNWLEEFLVTPPKLEEEKLNFDANTVSNFKGHSIGHMLNTNGQKTRIGVQKGSTLMQVLSDKTNSLSNKNIPDENRTYLNISKKERRYDIAKSIKDNGGKATITEIKTKAFGSLASCSEKTIQRELASMIKDGVLNKTGEKRWSMYSIVKDPT